MNPGKINHSLPDRHQTCWQLASIQLSGWTSLPIIATSVLVLQQNSLYGAALTIFVGNAILWFIRLAIILMSHTNRKSTLDISRDYLGKVGTYFIGTLCILSTLAWFVAQTTAASTTLTQLISIQENPNIDQFIQMSVLLGILSTFLCMNGIVVLRRLTTLVFPFLLIAFLIAMFTIPYDLPTPDSAALSLSGLTLVLGTNLGITSDMPTFFRHSQSLKTSINALTVIQLGSLILALLSIFFGSIVTGSFQIDHIASINSENTLLRLALIALIFLSVICANVANVYSASVGWEVIAPTALVGKKEYLILGLGLTTIFILISNVFSIDFLLNSTDDSLVNLCLVLTIGYVIQRFRRQIPTRYEQATYFIAWLVSTLINILQLARPEWLTASPLVASICSILVVLACSFLLQRLTGRIQNLTNTK